MPRAAINSPPNSQLPQICHKHFRSCKHRSSACSCTAVGLFCSAACIEGNVFDYFLFLFIFHIMSVAVHITGFGRFQGVDDNPSCHLARGLATAAIEAAQDPRIRVASARVVEVSMAAADAALADIFQCVPDDSAHVIIVHLGVAAAAKCFHLEGQAVNDCSFRCPDESGAQPQGKSICPQLALDSFLTTPLPLRVIAARLHEKWHPRVEISSDAGRFLCNYIYYCSLQHAMPRKQCYSVFIHVPLHTVIDLKQQAEFVCDFVRFAADHILGAAAAVQLPAQLSSHEEDAVAVSASKSGLL
jgi:pyroglutamyl-peptidase